MSWATRKWCQVPKTRKPDCRTCGICCVAPTTQHGFADLQPPDERRLGVRLCNKHVIRASTFDLVAAALDGRTTPSGVIRTQLLVVKQGPLAGTEVCACHALQGDPMHSVSCHIYNRRPDTCRNSVSPGDKTCRILRGAIRKYMAKEAREEKGKVEKVATQRRR